MVIEKVSLYNFRNYSLTTVALSKGVNVFFGSNAQGKTNFLESVRFMSIGKAMRMGKDKDLIKWDENVAQMQAIVNCGPVNKTVTVTLYKNDKKRIQINGIPITKMGELMGVITTVLFSPAEISIIKNAPSDRRRFIDIALCQISKTYFYSLSKYNKILDQRNALLKSGKADENSLYVWDVQLAKEGAKIAKTRAGFIQRLQTYANDVHSYISDGKETLTLKYEGVTGETIEEIEKAILSDLSACREKDLRYGYTNCGVQTDDVKVEVNGVDLRKYGSQGQQRTGALSLKLAEVELLKEKTGEYPILLLDDVFSELDLNRQRKLLEKIKHMQTIITCTDFDYQMDGVEYFSVVNGVITPQKNVAPNCQN